ncbi:hypothetical protein [Arthrospira platensis]|nr:hypothetical protein [Arthrospira platensis]AMW29399.1 hypothetical protein AP285_17065 [Arthrospira platensis YZ]KDR56735.1 hypothetical protein APPUASWS_014705 [Arthrospira platensis str. Paraca]MBD2671598.1 hypothetical protein [Arthrospira platensis FACHB-439]MBD2712527.1 hypothetical protein [Arthrospira platensis FACHB-835]MDT9185103.1 hypothetical protein [Limnospira sp. PMC 289.06]MDT9297268.1 hypothetical protein [Arthrospira platensis PCC 7345]MDT9312779.1 hypothetical protein [
MDVINPNANNQAIRSNWRLLNGISVLIAVTASPVWFFTPFLTYQNTLRWLSISYGMGGGAGLLLTSNELAKLKPKITALNKQEEADFKHSVASSLYLTQQTNQAIAEFLNFQRHDSLYAQPELLDSHAHGEFRELPEKLESSELASQFELAELSKLAERYQQAVLDALDKGMIESKIIKDVMGLGGAKYAKGRAVLELIKQDAEYED